MYVEHSKSKDYTGNTMIFILIGTVWVLLNLCMVWYLDHTVPSEREPTTTSINCYDGAIINTSKFVISNEGIEKIVKLDKMPDIDLFKDGKIKYAEIKYVYKVWFRTINKTVFDFVEESKCKKEDNE